MSKIDRLKEEIGWLKVVFGILVAIEVSLIAWLSQNYASVSKVLVILSSFGVFIITSIVVWVNRAAMKRFKELEDE